MHLTVKFSNGRPDFSTSTTGGRPIVVHWCITAHSRWYTCCDATSVHQNGRPVVHQVYHLMHHIPQPTTYGCGLWHATSIANLLHWRSQCSTVRCLHLTVNLQWKLLIFTPKRSFGVKTCISAWKPASQDLRPEMQECTLHHNGVVVQYVDQDEVLVHFYWSSPYGLDQYALQALRPEVQKEKELQYTPQALRPEVFYTNFLFKKKVGQRKVYASQALRPEMLLTGPALTGWTSIHLRPYGLRCQKKRRLETTSTGGWGGRRPHLPGRKSWKMLVLPSAAKQ